MSEQLYVSQKINLQKDFLMRIHSHELLTQINGLSYDDGIYKKMWENHPNIIEHRFGGLYGTQFLTVDDYLSFSNAFDSALVKHNIAIKYKSNLLYLISLVGEDYQKQSSVKDRLNRLRAYARFILDLHANCSAHFDSMVKNKEYQMIFDEARNEYFFARKTIFESMPLEEIVEYRPNVTPGDTVWYLRIPIYETELYVPDGMLFTIISDRKLKTFEGEAIADLMVPHFFRSEIFKYTVSQMLEEHKKYDTDFYKALSGSGATRSDFTAFYNQYKKHNINFNQSVVRVGKVISDYLIDNKLSKNKSSVSAFLFDYFSLFKLIPLKNEIEFPVDYSEIPKFYNRNGVTKDTIRNMMKDAVIVGGI
jgi:hypothetical protein